MVVLFVSMTIMGTFFNPILSTTVNIENSKELTPNYINNMNGLERVHSIFKENVSHNETIRFEDIDRTYEVTQLAEDYSVVRENIRNNESFEVNNKTNIRIEFKSEPTSPGNNSYDIQIKLNGEVIVEDYNLSNNTLIEIDNDYIYNEETGETNYGEFEININENRVNVVAEVLYNKLDYREVELSNENFTRTLIINDNEVYFE